MNKKKLGNIFLLISLGLTSTSLLVDRFVMEMPDWLTILVSILAAGALICHIVIIAKKR